MPAPTRRGLLIGGGAAIGLVVAWGLWPRDYAVNLVANPGETVFGAWLKIGTDGHVTVAAPQLEGGQGVYTALAQIVADELGADWRTVGVEAAPLNPLYANPLALEDLFEGAFARIPDDLIDTAAQRAMLMLTGGSTSVRMFEEPCRIAAAGARVLLLKAAAARWGVDWTACSVDSGFVVYEGKRLRFAELAAEAASGGVPDPLPLGEQGAGKLSGQSLPRIDAPAKVDGSANFTGDVRLPDMVHAAIRQGPVGDSRLVSVDRAAADGVRGVLEIVENPRWVAAVATTWWAANRALDALAPRFETRGPIIDSPSIDGALTAALNGDGARIAATGDLAGVFRGARLVTATYDVALGVHAAIETTSATAAYRDGRLELWAADRSPGPGPKRRGARRRARRKSCRRPSDARGRVVRRQSGTPRRRAGRDPRGEAAPPRRPRVVAARRDPPRPLPPPPPERGWRRGSAATARSWAGAPGSPPPPTGAELARRIMPGALTHAALLGRAGDPYAVAGARPPYRLPAYAIDHHSADIGVPTGHLRGGAHGYTAFFTECFLDEVAHLAGSEPLSYRIGMLGGDARLARCLSSVAALGGWEGGVPGSGQGVACHAFRGSYIAVLAEAHIGDDQKIIVDRLVAAIDCGRMINPDMVRQQIEGGLIFGLGQALGASTGFTRNLADVRGFAGLDLPRLADTPDIIVDFVRSEEDPGGVSELGVPAVAPAIANALQAATGYRIRSLPLRSGR